MIGRDGEPLCICGHGHRQPGQCRSVYRSSRCGCPAFRETPPAPPPATSLPRPPRAPGRRMHSAALLATLAAMGAAQRPR